MNTMYLCIRYDIHVNMSIESKHTHPQEIATDSNGDGEGADWHRLRQQTDPQIDMRKEGRCRYVIDVPTRSFSWLPGMEEKVGTAAKTAVRKRTGRHGPWGTQQRAETMPINQRLVHLAMPSGTPLCAEGKGGIEKETGTVAKPPLILLVGVSLPCLNGARHGEKKRKFSPYFESVVLACCQHHHSRILTRLLVEEK